MEQSGSTTSLGICTTEVPSEGQGTLAANIRRITAAQRIIDVHRPHRGIHAFAFPAGFLRAEKEDDVIAVAEPILASAQAAGRAVMVGVDTEPLRHLPASRTRERTLPSFLVAWSPTMGLQPWAWRQRCRTRADAAHIAGGENRILEVFGWPLSPFIGGEVFSPELRAHADCSEVAVLCAHFSLGSRHWQGLEALRALGVPSVRSVHAAQPVAQMLNAPRGYRLANLSLMEQGIFASTYFIDETDKARDVTRRAG